VGKNKTTEHVHWSGLSAPPPARLICSHLDARRHVHPPGALPAASGRVQHGSRHVRLQPKAGGRALPRWNVRRRWYLRERCAILLLLSGCVDEHESGSSACRLLCSFWPSHLMWLLPDAAAASAPAVNVSALGFPYPYLDPECWRSGACYPAYDAAGTVSMRAWELEACTICATTAVGGAHESSALLHPIPTALLRSTPPLAGPCPPQQRVCACGPACHRPQHDIHKRGGGGDGRDWEGECGWLGGNGQKSHGWVLHLPACMLSMLWQTVACCIMAACVCIRTLPQGALEAAALGNVTQAILGAWDPAINSSTAAPQLLANDLAAFMRGRGALAPHPAAGCTRKGVGGGGRRRISGVGRRWGG